jgi:hypothetical protein
MVSNPRLKFKARMDPPKRAKARTAAMVTRHAERAGFAFKFCKDKALVLRTYFFMATLITP